MAASISFLSVLHAEGLGAHLISFLNCEEMIHFTNISKDLRFQETNSDISKTKTHIRFMVAGFLKESQTQLEQYFCKAESFALLEKTWSVLLEAI